MAITHNLSDPADSLSGFDPVAGESDGTSIGRSWLLWKIFEGFSAFFTNYVKITNASPTPTFLQGDVGSNLQTEPTKSRNVAGDSIRFYDTNDPGLLEATPRATVYTWVLNSTGGTGINLIDFQFGYHKSGDALQANPTGADAWLTGTASNVDISMYCPNMAATTTIMSNIPKIIFWKSSNFYAFMAILKGSGLNAGYALWADSSMEYAGYKHNVGAITHDRVNILLGVGISGGGLMFVESIENDYAASQSSQTTGVTNITLLSSAGRPPTGLFTFSAIQNVIGSNLRMGYVNGNKIKVVSDPIEGLLLCSAAAVAGSAGLIETYNSKYYLLFGTINDGVVTHKVILELEAV